MKVSDSKIGFLEKTLVISLLIGVVVCIFIIAFGTLTSKEGAILSLLLTFLSITASWIISRIYSESQHAEAIKEVKDMHNENLRTYALKAAEKVNNLSKQLTRLSSYIEEELQNSEYESDSESLSAKEERLGSAIHMIAMLKSVNDTSLSDWQGVIGDEIEEQREEQEEQEEKLIELIERAEILWKKSTTDNISSDELNEKIEELKRQIKILASTISGSHIPVQRVKRRVKRELVKECPSCGNKITYIQRARKNSIKPLVCSNCSTALISRYKPDLDIFEVIKSGPARESINCPACDSKINVMVDTMPHSKQKISCDTCEAHIKIKRLIDGSLRTTLPMMEGENAKLTDEFLRQVKGCLPEQPWPKHVHKAVAGELSVSNSSIQAAIQELIKRGDFKQQINGKLYELHEVADLDEIRNRQ